MVRFAYDAGHGINTAGKRCDYRLDPKSTREWTLNNRIVNYVEAGLKEYTGYEFIRLDDRTGVRDVPLSERAVKANNAKVDIVISVHHDAGANLGSGCGATVYTATVSSPITERYQKSMYNSLLKHNPVMKGNRAQPLRTAGFYIISKTYAPALLIEHGYMDSRVDVPLILSDKFARDSARGHIDFLVKEFKLPKKSVTPPVTGKIAINGKPVATYKQMAKLLLSKNPNPKIKIKAEELTKLFIEEGNKENIRGDIAFCQSMHETGWLKYGGLVLPEQNNYSGIGATNNSAVGKGAWFKDPREGVRAQIQHLKAYADTLPLNNPKVDPRFHLVTRGIAPNWTDLNGKWAYPGTTYGQSILSIYEILVKVLVEDEEKEPVVDTKELEMLQAEVKRLNAELEGARSKLKNIGDIANS